MTTVGIVGAGTMGAGIAEVVLGHGDEVVLHDVDPAAVERARARVAEGLARRPPIDGDVGAALRECWAKWCTRADAAKAA